MTNENPTVDKMTFRQALGSFTTGVTVVTTRGDEGDVGLTANSFNSVSLEPPMVLWSLAKSAFSLSAFRQAEHFAVHILSVDQENVSNQFAKAGKEKFAGVELERGPDDIPLLRQCAARFICKTTYQYEGGDHIIFVGEVVDFDHWQREPLLFHSGQYKQIRSGRVAADAIASSNVEEHTLGYLLRLCAHQLFQPLKEELARRGLGIAQYHFLSLAGRGSQTPLADLKRMLKQGDTVISDEGIEKLASAGLIQGAGGVIGLTEKGSRLHVELASVYKSAESGLLKSLDFEKQQSLKLGLLEVLSKSERVVER